MDEILTKAKPDIAPDIVRTILQDGVDFEVTAGLGTLLRRLKLTPASRTFIIYPINLGTLFNISKVILTMTEIESLEGEDLFAVGIRNITENKDKMLEVVALAILNRRISTPWVRLRKWMLKRYLDANLDPRELLKLASLVIAQMDVTDFLASFVSIKRLNLVEAKRVATVS